MTGSGPPENGAPVDIRTDIAHPARIYDYWLGGKDNYRADRAAADQGRRDAGDPDTVRENREFLRRAVRYLATPGSASSSTSGPGCPRREHP